MKKMISYLGEHIEVTLTPVTEVPAVGDVVWVFDSKLWSYKDVGDNSRFWMEAEVLKTYCYKDRLIADVQFIHDGRESKGHLVREMYFFDDKEESVDNKDFEDLGRELHTLRMKREGITKLIDRAYQQERDAAAEGDKLRTERRLVDEQISKLIDTGRID